MDPDNNNLWRPIVYALALGPGLLYALFGPNEANHDEVQFSLLVGGVLLAPVGIGVLRIVMRLRRAAAAKSTTPVSQNDDVSEGSTG